MFQSLILKTNPNIWPEAKFLIFDRSRSHSKKSRRDNDKVSSKHDKDRWAISNGVTYYLTLNNWSLGSVFITTKLTYSHEGPCLKTDLVVVICHVYILTVRCT